MTILLAILLAATQTFANATVVSTDVAHRKLTFRRPGRTSEELAVDAAAAAMLATLKPGDAVVLTLSGEPGVPPVVAVIARSMRGTRPARRAPAGEVSRPPAPAAPSPSPAASPAVKKTAPAKASAPPASDRPPSDTVGPLQDPRKGAQQDPRDNPSRDPRVVPGLTEPPSPVPSPTPTPN